MAEIVSTLAALSGESNVRVDKTWDIDNRHRSKDINNGLLNLNTFQRKHIGVISV